MPYPDMPESGAKPGPEGSPPSDKKLDSWKEIADYLDREVRTVQRWEKSESLPVHRHEHQKKSTVYAFASELDEWRKKRQPKDDPVADAAFVPEPDEADEVFHSEQNHRPAAQGVGDIAPGPSTKAANEKQPEKIRLARWLGAAVIGASLIALLSYGFFTTLRSHSPRPGERVRLVVLPFTNLSGDPKQDYFSAGLTDEMITRLGSLDPQRLGVIAATSSNALAGKPIAEIGRALNVQYALEGSVRRDGNRVRIDVQLVQVSDQTHLWADKYDRELNDILRVQDEVATAVANQIQLALSPSNGTGGGHASSHTVNPEAYDAYLRGRFYWTNRSDLRKGIESYQLAIQKDPQYALAYAGLASAYFLLGQVPYDVMPPTEAKPKARDAAERALQLDPQLSEAHAVLANVAFSYDWDFENAEREFQRAFTLNPNNPTPHLWYGHFCITRNRLSRALEENSRALDLDPVSPLFNSVRAEIQYHSRNYDAAIDQARRTVEQYPTYWPAYIWLGSALREKRIYRDALEQFSQGRRLSGNHPVMIALYGHALAVSGDAAGARTALAELEQLSQSHYVSPLYLAMIHTGLGENQPALDLLDRAYSERTDRLVYLGAEPMADPLRSEPRFTQLLHKIGIQ